MHSRDLEAAPLARLERLGLAPLLLAALLDRMRCTRAALPRRAAMCCPGARRLREFVVATTLSEAWPAES
jgi:hypothetical protein